MQLKVASDQTQYIASNSDSWITAKENADIARPFVIKCGREIAVAVEISTVQHIHFLKTE